MGRLKAALIREYENEHDETDSTGEKSAIEKVKPTFYNPRNTSKVELYFRGEKMAKVMGSLAEKKPEDGTKVSVKLSKLCNLISKIRGLERIRYLTSHPNDIVPHQTCNKRTPCIDCVLPYWFFSLPVVPSHSSHRVN